MSITEIIVFFVIIWWLIFFIILPIGLVIEENPKTGHATSAPKNPNIAKKMLLSTIISSIITLLFFFLKEYGYFDFITISHL